MKSKKIELNKTKIKNKEKGITLTVLVITIIILLILVGVVINLSLGEGGIFRRAQEGSQIYENASYNEKREIDKVINYIDDYNNGTRQEQDDDVITNVKEAIKNGTVYENNTTIYDEYSNPVKVPAGFKLAQDSGTDVTKGIVIEDATAGDSNTKGNQYVWVPIGNVKYDTNGEYKTINFGRYIFASDGTPTIQQSADDYKGVVEIDTGLSYKFKEVTSEESNTIAKNLGDYITKAKNARGYYIGRYEAGKVIDNTNTFNVKKGQEVYNEVTQSEAAALARNLYSENINFQSDLINSYAWDTAIIFMQIFSGDTDYSTQTSLQDTLATTGNAHDSNNNYDERCNIYDIAGNVMEWSTETYTSNISSCTIRGGSYIMSTQYTSRRNGSSTEGSSPFLGYRSILYL